MKDQLYKKMEPLFHLIEHKYTDISTLETLLIQLARGNTFNTRIVGLENIKKFRAANPDCSITFKPNHLSEADFILLCLSFRENNMKVLTEGGSNLFINGIDIFRDFLPKYVDPGFNGIYNDKKISIADYLSLRGAFKVIREPGKIELDNGKTIKIGNKEILSLSRAYRYHLVKNKEMYVTFPGYSVLENGVFDILEKDVVKTGRSYTGRTDGFHHLPFQMDIEASHYSGIDLYIVDVNIAYEPVMEDINFIELLKLTKSGLNQEELYLEDIGYIVKEFCRNKVKGDLCIKFGDLYRINSGRLKDDFFKIKVKQYAKKIADQTFEKVLSMQPVFPANIYFSAFSSDFSNVPEQALKEKINELRDHLRKLMFGQYKRKPDIHYLLDYDNNIISADEIINRTFLKFNNTERQITDLDSGMFVINRKDVAMQYKNHTRHFFDL